MSQTKLQASCKQRDYFAEPYVWSLLTQFGASRRFLEVIASYAAKARRMHFLELFFPTLATQNNLKLATLPNFLVSQGGLVVPNVVTCADVYAHPLNWFHPAKPVHWHKLEACAFTR